MKIIPLILLTIGSAWAQELPNPLRLDQALALASKDNLSQQQQQLDISHAQLQLDSLDNLYNTNATLDLSLASRSDYGAGTNNSHAFIYLKKTLFDQQIEINKQAQLNQLSDKTSQLTQLQHEKHIDIMRGFFDVVLADMAYETALEKLAMSAIREGRVKDDYDIGHASEVALLEKQTNTQLSQIERLKAESIQIQSRAILAQLLDLDYDQRPDDVIKPSYSHLFKKPLAEFEVYQAKLGNNLKLKQLQQSLLALNTQISQEKDNLGIVLSSNARLGDQAYQQDKNGHWRVGLNLSMPFGSDAKQANKITNLQIKAKQLKLDIKQHQHTIQAQALEYYFTLKSLEQIQKALLIELDYRDLYLEKARADYEMEIKSDIGNAMTNYTNSERKLAENEFNYVITLKQLHHLIGGNYEI
ncbi:MAG: TolC family protein [Candidatus Thioglobus sp.]|nr:TolC family protein [Candidatus Thioglobus pontius]MBL6977021.1 TolC family protein [Candidatus Thioglobus sp.]MBL6984851.1 TolC family protein [Candidatus Thioglobus sp.]